MKPLNDKSWTPEFVLRAALEEAADIEAVVCVVKYKDKSADCFTSVMTGETLCFLQQRLQFRITDELFMQQKYIMPEQ